MQKDEQLKEINNKKKHVKSNWKIKIRRRIRSNKLKDKQIRMENKGH